MFAFTIIWQTNEMGMATAQLAQLAATSKTVKVRSESERVILEDKWSKKPY